MYYGEKVILRAYDEKDIDLSFKYINDIEVRKYFTQGVPYPFPYDEEKKWVFANNSRGDLYNFAIEDTESGLFIGGCSITEIDWKNSHARVGIFIGDAEYRGKGYGTDAMKALLKFIFEQMNINKVELTCFEFNQRAIKSYEKCGLKVDGRLRQHVFRDGKYYDEIVMSILKEEYFSR